MKKTSRPAPPRHQPTTPPVHFDVAHPSARRICIAGSFNDWRPDTTEMIPLGDGKWSKELALEPGTYEYRLVVDGEWMADPHCTRTVPNPFGQLNSLLIVPAPAEPRGRKSA